MKVMDHLELPEYFSRFSNRIFGDRSKFVLLVLKEILQSSGFFYGFVIGRIIEHRYVDYVVKERKNVEKIKVYAIGILAATVLLVVPMLAIPVVGTFIGGILMMSWCFGLYPMVMKKKDW
jgi:hypothetical protein